jgi:hypothetical protein
MRQLVSYSVTVVIHSVKYLGKRFTQLSSLLLCLSVIELVWMRAPWLPDRHLAIQFPNNRKYWNTRDVCVAWSLHDFIHCSEERGSMGIGWFESTLAPWVGRNTTMAGRTSHRTTQDQASFRYALSRGAYVLLHRTRLNLHISSYNKLNYFGIQENIKLLQAG